MVIGIDCSRAFVKSRTGTENYSYNLVSEILRLPASNNHFFVLFVRPNVVVPEWVLEYDNVEVVVIKYRYLWTQVGLAIATWRTELDVLWVPAHTLPVMRDPRVRTVVTIHGLEYQWLREYRNILQRWYLPLSTIYATKQADQLIAVSKFTASQLVEQLHTVSEKIKVVYEGARLSSTQGGPAGLVKKDKYILFVGTLMPRKNLSALVEAFSLINREYPDYKLVIVGGKGWMTEEIFVAPGRYEVQEKVVFTGRVSEEELTALYQGASLYVQASHTEGFGLPVIEAMQAGVPVVSSDGGALGEVVGSAGLVVKLGRGFPRRLARSMERVLSDASLRRKLVKAGKKRVGELTWEKAARETLEVLLDSVS